MITFNKGTRHLAENAQLGQKTRELTKVPLSKSLTWPMRDLAKLSLGQCFTWPNSSLYVSELVWQSDAYFKKSKYIKRSIWFTWMT